MPGVPQVAAGRAVRLASQSPSTWASGPASLVSLRDAGFDLAGEVMGCVASVLSSDESVMCGYRTGTARVRLVTNSAIRARGRSAYPQRAEGAYQAAIDRLRDEASARRADGVVGVTRYSQHLEGDLVETVLTGLAVRARCNQRPARPFLTGCSACEVATLLKSGWVPVDLHVAVAVGLRHDDSSTEHVDQIRQNRAMRRSNFELPGFSELTAAVRSSVRSKLESQLRTADADYGVLEPITMSARHSACRVLLNRTDRMVQAVGWANSFARFGARSSVVSGEPLVVALSSLPSRRSTS